MPSRAVWVRLATMVNIVVVSHSKKLAQGVVELASQMTQGSVKFAIAAGIDDTENPIGTDPIAVMTAIQDVQSDDGVLVMMDIGSAILSTDMALELLGEAFATKVHVCAAPLVEGTVAAAVAAASGLPMRQVIEEAHQALTAKYRQLNQNDTLSVMKSMEQENVTTLIAPPVTFTWTVINSTGIHARPASAIATCMSQFTAEVRLVKGEQVANAKSMNAIALLAIKCGDVISLQASGEQARDAVEAFARLAATHFGDGDNAAKALLVEPQDRRDSLQASVHLRAMVCRVERVLPAVVPRDFIGEREEMNLLSAAMEVARQELDVLVEYTLKRLSEKEADIFTAQRLMLEDGELLETAQTLMAEHAEPVEHVWLKVIEQLAKEYRDIDDTYLRERYIDIYDVGTRVLRCLNGEPEVGVKIGATPSVIVANLLLPSEAVRLEPTWVKAIYFTDSGRTSHAAILATALGIPVFLRRDGTLCSLVQDQMITFDADSGEISGP